METRMIYQDRTVARNSSQVSAKLDHGVLTVTVPKAQDPGSVEVEVQ